MNKILNCAFFSAKNYILWIVIALIFNSFYFYYTNILSGNNLDGFIKYNLQNSDTFEYVYASENFLKNGNFFCKYRQTEIVKSNYPERIPPISFDYAFRTPGYSIFYIPLRLFFTTQDALKAMLLFQIFCSALSKYLLALLILKIFNRRILFYLFFFLINFSYNMVFYNNYLLTEPLAFFSLVCGIYLFYLFREKKKISYLFFSGFFFMCCFFLRPFIAPFFLLLIIFLFFEHYKKGIKSAIRYVFIFTISILLAETAWIGHNYYFTNKFIPIAVTADYIEYSNLSLESQVNLSKIQGLSILQWEKNSPTYWFCHSDDDRMPSEVFINKMISGPNISDSLKKAKVLYLQSTNSNYSIEIRKIAEKKSATMINDIFFQFEKNNLFYSLIISRVNILTDFLLQPSDQLKSTLQYPFNVIQVFTETFINYFVFIIGFFASFWGLYYFFRKNVFISLLAFIPLFLVSYFALFLLASEYRELFLAFPFLLMFGLLLLIIPKYKFKWLINSLILFFTIVFSAFYTYNHINW